MIATRLLFDRLTQLTFAALVLGTFAMVAMKPVAHHRVVVTETSIEILADVTFVGDTISTRSLHTLDALAATLEGNPSIQLVEVQASTLAHAQAAVDYLIGAGVDPARVEPGLNQGSPIAAFLIVKRASDL